MAVFELAARFRIKSAFAPGGNEWNPEYVLQEFSIGFLIFGNPGVVMQPLGLSHRPTSVSSIVILNYRA
jgi:hypothetical protein